VLGLVVTDRLYQRFPSLPEGDLARIRAGIVSTEALAPIASRLGLGDALRLGRGEELSGGRRKASLLADALEALIGALYLSGGIECARRLVEERFAGVIEEEATRSVLGDPKNALQELAAQRGEPAPSYTLAERGPDHEKSFEAVVSVAGVTGHGEGRSKKQAERRAAAEVLARLVEAAGTLPGG
jgi:ribonuclease III